MTSPDSRRSCQIYKKVSFVIYNFTAQVKEDDLKEATLMLLYCGRAGCFTGGRDSWNQCDQNVQFLKIFYYTIVVQMFVDC